MVKFHRLEIRRALYLHYSNNKVWVAGVCKLRFLELRAPKISTCYTALLGWKRRWKQEEGGVEAIKKECAPAEHTLSSQLVILTILQPETISR